MPGGPPLCCHPEAHPAQVSLRIPAPPTLALFQPVSLRCESLGVLWKRGRDIRAPWCGGCRRPDPDSDSLCSAVEVGVGRGGQRGETWGAVRQSGCGVCGPCGEAAPPHFIPGCPGVRRLVTSLSHQWYKGSELSTSASAFSSCQGRPPDRQDPRVLAGRLPPFPGSPMTPT